MAAGRTACVQWPTYYDAMAAWRSSVADVMAMAPSLQEEVRPRGRGAPAGHRRRAAAAARARACAVASSHRARGRRAAPLHA
jgi:hypothetical protein